MQIHLPLIAAVTNDVRAVPSRVAGVDLLNGL